MCTYIYEYIIQTYSAFIVYVYMYICICIYTYTYIYIYIYMYNNLYIYIPPVKIHDCESVHPREYKEQGWLYIVQQNISTFANSAVISQYSRKQCSNLNPQKLESICSSEDFSKLNFGRTDIYICIYIHYIYICEYIHRYIYI